MSSEGAALQLLLEPLDQRRLGLRVHRAGRLVEDQHRRAAGERAGERDRLALAARQALAAVGEPEVVAVGDRAHELVGAGKLGGAEHLLVVDMASRPSADILAHRAGQQHALLQRGADVSAACSSGSSWRMSVPSIITSPSSGG